MIPAAWRFSADEQELLALLGSGADIVIGFVHQLGGLHQVNDVNPIARGVDVGIHFGIPPSGLVPEVDSRL